MPYRKVHKLKVRAFIIVVKYFELLKYMAEFKKITPLIFSHHDDIN